MSGKASASPHWASKEPLFETVRLAGLPISVIRPEEAASRLCEEAKRADKVDGVAVHLVNAYSIALSDRDLHYAEILQRSSANLPDGKPLTWVGRFRKSQMSQVRGPSLFAQVMDVGRSSELRHFLLGATEDTLHTLKRALITRYPGIHLVGQYSPPFRVLTPDELEEQDRIIAESAAQIVWVGLGTPKQDLEVHRISRSMPVVAVGVGAAFDFVAGTKAEAPRWMTQAGLEWLFRLLCEPRRLWRRYLFGNIQFLWAVLTKR